MHGITKTIPAAEGDTALSMLYDGSATEYEFHMAGTPSNLAPGDFVYTIFRDQLHGRCRITRLMPGATNPDSGKPRTLVYVACPGERLPAPIPMQGHRGTRYTDGAFWPVD